MACPLVEGYGISENFAPATVVFEDDLSLSHIGGPLASVEMKLVDVPEMNYFVTGRKIFLSCNKESI